MDAHAQQYLVTESLTSLTVYNGKSKTSKTKFTQYLSDFKIQILKIWKVPYSLQTKILRC